MENNSDFIRPTPESPRIKVVDCQVMNSMLQDLLAHKTVLKVLDEEYIFIKRSVSVKDQASSAPGKGRPHSQRETLESDNLVLDKNRRQVVVQNIINNQEGMECT
jgi:hypothetical protein